MTKDKYKIQYGQLRTFESRLNMVCETGYVPIWETYRQWVTKEGTDYVSVVLAEPLFKVEDDK